jgi:hypothetical protein
MLGIVNTIQGKGFMKYIILLLFSSLLFVSCSSKVNKSSCCMQKVNSSNHNHAPVISQDEMLKMMTELATPGEDHLVLNSLVGKWKTVSKIYSSDSKNPLIEKGNAVHKWVLDKRFIHEEFSGKWMGKTFKGLGMLGYDKVKKVYTSSWVDTMGTGIMTSEGTYSIQDKTLTMNTVYSCPVSGASKKGKNVTKIISNKEHIFEMYDIDSSGKDVKMMEITYTRN